MNILFFKNVYGVPPWKKGQNFVNSHQGWIFFFWKFYPMPDHDFKKSTLASKACFGPYPPIKWKTHQIWPTLKWKSYFFGFFLHISWKIQAFQTNSTPAKEIQQIITQWILQYFSKYSPLIILPERSNGLMKFFPLYFSSLYNPPSPPLNVKLIKFGPYWISPFLGIFSFFCPKKIKLYQNCTNSSLDAPTCKILPERSAHTLSKIIAPGPNPMSAEPNGTIFFAEQ